MAETTVKGQIVTKNDAGKLKSTTVPHVNPEASMEVLAESLALYGSFMADTPVEIRRLETRTQEV